MARRSFGGRFRSLGELGPGATGLPVRRLRDLALADAWRRVAGEAIARRTGKIRVARGTLVIEAPDRRWAEVLSTDVPRLAGRLAAEVPGAGIRRASLRIEGESGSFAEFEVAAVARDGPVVEARRGDRAPGGPTGEPAALHGSPEGLERLAERYARAARRGSGRDRPRGGPGRRP